jgi:nitroreductase
MPIDKVAALAARYGDASIPAAGPWNAVIASLLEHRSVRGFKTDAVPAGTLETLIAAAQSAATSSNMQTWSVVSVTDPAKKATFSRLSGNQKHIEQCPMYLVFLADLSRLERVGAAEGKTFEALPYLETFLVAAIDAALAAQNAVIAAESLGLSTVYIGAMRNDPETVARELDLPPGCMAAFGLCIGYALPGHESAVKPRLSQAAVLHYERYDTTHDGAARAAYDRAMATFSAGNERQSYTWTERVIARVGHLSALNGRDRLVEALRRLGFPLQ